MSLTTFHKLKKNAKNINHFFHMVIDDLTITRPNRPHTDLTRSYCKIPSGNLEYDNWGVKSYGIRILYLENESNIIIDGFSLTTGRVGPTLRSKIQKHMDELIRILDLDEIDYIIDYLGDENRELEELFHNNKKRYWLLHDSKSTVVQEKGTCSIDLEEYDELIKTECGHLFNENNLYSWLKEHNNKTCPLCRTKLW